MEFDTALTMWLPWPGATFGGWRAFPECHKDVFYVIVSAHLIRMENDCEGVYPFRRCWSAVRRLRLLYKLRECRSGQYNS